MTLGERDETGRDAIRTYVVGGLQTNCYAYVSAGEAMVVDPGASGAALAEALADVRVTQIVATHGHGDHVGGVRALKEATGAEFSIHPADAELASRAGRTGQLGMAHGEDAPTPDCLLAEGDVVRVGTARFRVLETPGHTPGGITLVGEDTAVGVAFVGDTLFAGSVGRTDLEGGDHAQLLASLGRLKALIDPSTAILSGHGPRTTMGRELRANPYLAEADPTHLL